MIIGIGIGLTVKVRVRLPVPNALIAESVIVLVPAVVGLPEITPVGESRIRPCGSPLAVRRVVSISVVIV